MAHVSGRTSTKDRQSTKDRRSDKRDDTEQLIVVRTPKGDLVGELLDISASGAKLRIRDGLCPETDEAVSIVLLDKTELAGTVSRIDKKSIGIAFDIKLLQPADYLHHDHLGFDFYRSIQSLQSKRLKQK
ncbi:PilZ domain-containing protein [Filomicrobium insigne]|uniref:PilZ domain-containing protein n=1 Tax=Filomicrobium insigne TaxID=418854 RepID=A0A1H0NQ35_9HYPH|nr:PilZ domain-containing protein [Filomicrobium insigne]SDO94686.1 PilZ domain-containing protein [Filomicrobium insigne]